MTVREFINHIIDGSFTKNDVLLQSEKYPDKDDLHFQLKVAQTFTKSDTEYNRLDFAMGWLCEQYPTLISWPYEGVDNDVDPIKHQEEAQIPQIQAQEPLKPLHQVNVPADRKRGRQTKPFRSVIISKDPDGILAKMHSLIDGKIGKDVALVIYAAMIKGKITKPTASQVQAEFGDIGNVSGYNKFMREKCFIKEELLGIANHFEEA